jgi:ABC-2 type transport system ATP-binding protein
LDDSTQNVLAAGCTVTGPAALVDGYVEGYRVLGSDTLGGIKSAYLLGLPDAPAPAGVEISRMKLQSLFIHLTNA